MPIPKMNTRPPGGLKRSSAPLTEPRAHLELFRIASERERIDMELRSLRTREAQLQAKLASLEARSEQIYEYLDKNGARSGRPGSADGAFVIEY